MSGALVDSDGFPRADVDIYAVRKARNRIICESLMHLSMLCPTTPRAGSVGGFVGEFCLRTPSGDRGLVVSTFRESACKCACVHTMWSF